MYITETTDEVRKVFDCFCKFDDLRRLKFVIYLFESLNNDQINSKNEVNPSLFEDEDLIIFNMELLGFSSDFCTSFLKYLVMLYNNFNESNILCENNGITVGIKYDNEEQLLISIFENLSFVEKLDILSELIIRYDNGTLFIKDISVLKFDTNRNGFEIAGQIQNYKKNI